MQYKLLAIFFIGIISKGFSQDFTEFFKGDEQEKTKRINEWVITRLDHPDSAAKNLPVFKQLLKKAAVDNDEIVSLSCRFYFAYIEVVIFRNEKKYLPEMESIIAEAEQKGYAYLYANFVHSAGVAYYYAEKQYAKGLEYMLRGHEKYTEIGYEKIIDASLRLFQLAHVYYQLENYEKCIELLIPAIHYPGYNDIYSRLQVLNTIGLAYRNLDKPDSALLFFHKTLSLAKDKGDSAWIGIASANIGKYYLRKGGYKKSAPYIHIRSKYIKLNDDRLSERDVAESLLMQAQLETQYGRLEKALEYLKLAEISLKAKIWYRWNRNDDLYAELYRMLSETYDQKKDPRNAYKYGTLAGQYDDSILHFKNLAKYVTIHTQVEAEMQLNRLKQLDDKKRSSISYRNFSTLVSMLAVLLLFSLYKHQRLKNKKNRELFNITEHLLRSEKTRAEEQLSSFIETFQARNSMIEKFQNEIDLLKQLPSQSKKLQTIETLEKLQQSTIITEDDWVHFRELFEKVHKGFLLRLKEKYPDVTPAEIRLIVLAKLNIPNKEMANMLGISTESIRKTGYRFLKKISDSGETNLQEVVASI